MGSYSHIVLAGDEKTKLKLHNDGSLFATSRLVTAMRALGAFVGELGDVSGERAKCPVSSLSLLLLVIYLFVCHIRWSPYLFVYHIRRSLYLFVCHIRRSLAHLQLAAKADGSFRLPHPITHGEYLLAQYRHVFMPSVFTNDFLIVWPSSPIVPQTPQCHPHPSQAVIAWATCPFLQEVEMQHGRAL